MHTLLACRLVLHVREVAGEEAKAEPKSASFDDKSRLLIQQSIYKERGGHGIV